MKVDFIIVGQGLAGTLLANELLRQNKTFVVFDDPDQHKASEVAAGLINPVVFRRMTKSWLVDDAFPCMETTYRQLEDLLNVKLYFPGRMLRILREDNEVLWKEKTFANKLEPYLNPEPDRNFTNHHISNAFSFGCVNKSGRLEIQKLISSFSELLEHRNAVRKEKFDFGKLSFTTDSVIYNDLAAQKIIFCEGSSVSQNPFFKNLKFKHSKGEILELEIQELKLNEIVSSDIFVMPAGANRYKVGATYSWDNLDWQITDLAREELRKKLEDVISAKYEILNQKAGIRPTMHDRKPVTGVHPEFPQIAIFNGLGSKGALIGPYFAKQLAEFMIGKSEYLHPEADINRYF